MARKIAALCPCGNLPAAGIAVLVYRVPGGHKPKMKTSRSFHLCEDCANKYAAENLVGAAKLFQTQFTRTLEVLK